jgi:hypothetical protein
MCCEPRGKKMPSRRLLRSSKAGLSAALRRRSQQCALSLRRDCCADKKTPKVGPGGRRVITRWSVEWAGEAAGVGTWGRTFQVWGCWFSGGHLKRCSWSIDQSGAQGENQRRRLLSCPAKRPAHDWVKTVGAGACSQRASGNWRGGVSSILGASLVSELSLAPPAAEGNRPLHALPPAPDRSSVDIWRAESGQPP